MRQHELGAAVLGFLVVAACAGVASPTPTSTPPSQLIPDIVAGVPLEVEPRRRLQPDDVHPGQFEKRVLDALGLPLEAYVAEIATPDEPEPFSVNAVRFEGADPRVAADVFFAELRTQFPDATFRDGTLAGRRVLFMRRVDTTWFYVGPHAIYGVLAEDEETAERIIGGLP